MNSQPQIEDIQKLFEIGAHMGHKKSRLHPSARKHVYQIINGTTVIDLTNTVTQLDEAKKFLTEAAKEGKIALVVGTKRVASKFIKDYGEENNVPYITTKWLPGLLTNFKTIMKNVYKLKDMKQARDSGEWDKFVKHERIQKNKEITKLEKLYSGLEKLENHPDILIMVDTKKEKNAVKEAQTYNIPIVALLDTNSNPENIDYPVVANDDSTKVVEYLMKDILDAYVKNYKKVEKKEKKEESQTEEVTN